MSTHIDATATPHEYRGCFNSSATGLFIQYFVLADNKGIPKVRITWHLWGESISHRWSSFTKGQQCEKAQSVSISLCHRYNKTVWRSYCLSISVWLSLSVSVSLSLCLYACLSPSLSLSLSLPISFSSSPFTGKIPANAACPSVSVRPSLSVPVCPSLSLSLCVSVSLSVFVPVSVFVCLSVCLSLSVSVSLPLSLSLSFSLSHFLSLPLPRSRSHRSLF